MKNNFLIITIILFVSSFGYSQESEYSWMRITDDARNYHNIIESYKNWMDSVYADSIPSAKIANIKDFYRFTNYWNARLGTDSTGMLSYKTYYKAATAVYQDPICNSSDPAEWELVGPGYSTEYQNLGLVDEVLFNPQVQNDYLLSTNHGGIWKYNSSDSSWQNKTDAMQLPGIAASEMFRVPSDTTNQHIIASTATGEWGTNYGFGIIESFDNGETWQVMEGFPNDNFTKVNRVIYDPYDTDYTDGLTLYAITDEHLYKSTNTGLYWTEINAPILDSGIVHNEYIDIEIADNGALFLTTIHKYGINGQAFKFHNNVWKDMNEDKINFDSLQRARITKPYHDTIFLLCDRRDDIDTTEQNRFFYESTDYGENWNLLYKGNNNEPWLPGGKNEIEYSPLSDIVYTGSIDLGVIRRNNSIVPIGAHTGHDDVRDIEFMGIDTVIADNDTAMFEKLLIANDGGITLLKYRITQHLPPPNFNVSKENLNGDHLPIGNFIGMAVNNSGGEIIAGGAVHCWTHVLHNDLWNNYDGGDGGDCEINWIDPSIYYIQSNRKMIRRIIGSQVPTTIYKGDSDTDWFIGMEYELNPNNPYILYGGRPNELLIYDEVSNDTTLKPTPTELKQVGAIGINNKNHIYISNFEGFHPEYDPSGVPYFVNNQFIKSIDNGNTWIDLSQKIVNGTEEIREILNWRQILDILLNPNDPDEMWISVGGIEHDSYGSGTYPGKLRVLHSTDAGESWTDYSDGLTALPCVALEYHMGSNNRLFAGTDAGVYYREPGMSQWECFMDGIPVGIVTDLDYDPCSNYLYASMDSRAIWKTPIPFSNPQLVLPDTITTWDYTKRINSDVTIPDGAELIITSNIYMAEGTKIMVERGGKLTLDGGLITNTCGGHWKGIEVWGNPNQSQTYANQGAVIVINDGTIENALCGVQSIKWSIPAGAESEQPDYAYSGGMIITSGANFINNRVAIKFWDYDYAPSASFIKNTNFETNDNMLLGTDPETYIIIDEIDGVDIYASTFTDDHTVTSPVELLTGIETFDATFKVTSYAGTPSYFIRLKDGIRALVRDPLKTPEITKNQFSNNLRSLYISSVSGAEVTGNDFIYWEDSVPTNEPSYCMYLDYCTDFTVEENDFFFNQQPLQDPTGIGLVINYSGPNNNEIYNNTFTNLEYATLAQGNNRGFFEDEGLTIKCNDYTENSQDIAVTSQDIALPGIAKNQGAPGATNMQAGNLFSLNNNGIAESDYSTFKEAPINYHHHDPTSEPRVEPDYYSEKFITLINEENPFEKEESCPPQSSGGSSGGVGERDGLVSTIKSNEYSADSTQAILTALVDGGNTQALEQDVLQSMPPETYNLYMSLMGKSPYLSDSVLIAAIEKEDVLPNVLIKDILVANPQSAKSPVILDKVEEKSNPMTPEMVAEILLGKYVVAAKERLESQLAFYKHQRSTALKFLKQSYWNDTINPWAIDSLIVLLENEQGLQEKIELAFVHAQQDDWITAINLVNNLPAQFSFNVYQQAFFNDFDELFELFYNLNQSGNGLSELSQSQVSNISQLADNSTNMVGAMARSILIQYDDYFYQEPIILPEEGLKYGSFTFDLPNLESFTPEYIKLYPNPAKEYIIIELLSGNSTGANLTLYDNNGRLIKNDIIPGEKQFHVLSIEDMPNGIYYIKVEMKGKILESKKFTKTK